MQIETQELQASLWKNSTVDSMFGAIFVEVFAFREGLVSIECPTERETLYCSVIPLSFSSFGFLSVLVHE